MLALRIIETILCGSILLAGVHNFAETKKFELGEFVITAAQILALCFTWLPQV